MKMPPCRLRPEENKELPANYFLIYCAIPFIWHWIFKRPKRFHRETNIFCCPNFFEKLFWKTDLILVSERGQVENAMDLIKFGVSLNSTVRLLGKTALHYAAEKNHCEIVNALLQAGASVRERDIFGKTALHYAAEKNHCEIVNALIQSGASVREQDIFGWTALHYCSEKGHVDIVRCLTTADPSVKYKTSWFNKTALHYSASKGHISVVELLLKKYSDVPEDQLAYDIFLNGAFCPYIPPFQTALHLSAKQGHRRVVKALIMAGADVNLIDYSGNTALHFCAKRGDLESARALIDAGANLKIENNQQETPIKLASKYKQHEMKMLIEQATPEEKSFLYKIWNTIYSKISWHLSFQWRSRHEREFPVDLYNDGSKESTNSLAVSKTGITQVSEETTKRDVQLMIIDPVQDTVIKSLDQYTAAQRDANSYLKTESTQTSVSKNKINDETYLFNFNVNYNVTNHHQVQCQSLYFENTDNVCNNGYQNINYNVSHPLDPEED